ncbi:hypothetical protein M3Y98_01157600 [Aphelenchoides besseyi]|nr:hypothetical protein M3Y98_01157600 [Aphelenchoides besseyi]KAI6210841.1 hypothetical protein M3Y96_00370700 [Aphelenchoides besseyi]
MSSNDNQKLNSPNERSESPDRDAKRPRPRGTSPLDINVKASTNQLPGYVAGTSPAKFITVEKLKQINDELANMAIAHEIALDPGFSIEKLKDQSTDGFTKQVTEIATRAFYDTICDKLKEQPPDYKAFFNLYAELKEMSMEVVTPAAKHLFDSVNVEEAKRQVELKCLDVHGLMLEFVNKLGQICAPIRDEQVEKLRKTTDPVEMLRGAHQLLTNMKDDMINFTIKQSRHQFLQHAAAYESEKFMKVLELYPNAADETQSWLDESLTEYLTRHSDAQYPLNTTQLRFLMAIAYARLLDGRRQDVRFPETLKYDMTRVMDLVNERLKLSLTLCGIFIASNLAGKQICETTDFKSTLKTRLLAILSDVNLKNYDDKLENVYLECNQQLEIVLKSTWTADKSVGLKSQVDGLKNADNSIRCIADNRIFTLISAVLVGPDGMSAEGSRLPPGLSVIEAELVSLISRYLSVSIHNMQSFGTFYLDRVNRTLKQRSDGLGTSSDK